ncbi:hypothetical protein Gasu2_34310 [Galdieria sulphuraria]|nr:hypothetical protein Gasu2_34310 [Galdieria sulphuraria]
MERLFRLMKKYDVVDTKTAAPISSSQLSNYCSEAKTMVIDGKKVIVLADEEMFKDLAIYGYQRGLSVTLENAIPDECRLPKKKMNDYTNDGDDDDDDVLLRWSDIRSFFHHMDIDDFLMGIMAFLMMILVFKILLSPWRL